MASVDTTGFKPVKLSFGQVHISGGYGSKSMPATSQTVDYPGDSTSTFVKMAATEAWLVFATTGQTRATTSSFGRTSLLEHLREKIQQFCDGEMSTSSSVAMDSEDYDPMQEVEQEQGGSEVSPYRTKSQGPKRMRYYKNHVKNSVVTLDMPVRCPREDPSCTVVRQIWPYITDRKTIWLHIDDVEWAVRFLYVQNLLKGVPLVSDDSTGPA